MPVVKTCQKKELGLPKGAQWFLSVPCVISGGGGALGILLQESSRVPPAAYTPRCPPRATLEHPCIPVVALV